MCGIVGAIGQRKVSDILIEGLKRLEYRGYDSAGMAVFDKKKKRINCIKTAGKVAALEEAVNQNSVKGSLGIAHTRWATHGKPSEANAHPHCSSDSLALVHNGIIENFLELKEELIKKGYEFITETDTEVIVHLIHAELDKSAIGITQAVKNVVTRLEGAYGLAIISKDEPEKIVVARSGSPLVIGVGIGENFIASDPSALGQVTDRFMYLEEGDIAEVGNKKIKIWNADKEVKRNIVRLHDDMEDATKGDYRHFMLKEIFEQKVAIKNTLAGRLSKTHVLEQAFGLSAQDVFEKTKSVQIVACGTSYHAGMIAKFWFENITRMPCSVDIASEYRYRNILVPDNCLFVTISQSGETADTLAALRYAKESGYVGTLAICNVPNSSMVRESDLSIMTVAGKEIGVASTKAFTTQLSILSLLAIILARHRGLAENEEEFLVKELHHLPGIIEEALKLDGLIASISNDFAEKHHALFLGRGVQYPVAKEGALKLKEISYIHAEAYPAGELKHGPLALVDNEMPIIAIAPNDELLEKLKSNLQEVSARGGKLYVFADVDAGFSNDESTTVINMPHCSDFLSPIVYTIPLQLLSYHVAVIKGTDVDQPRNLAKSVTVE
ncbi:MAG: glutamine--fructose-6-phosphate transaminase (isomerizing) [SAR86 cluster bacterium]|uniref:Glutamine--fructose-6-phosphate aminotransferase [isomerizing] n=1 Tax=SAR86 cluster bacterium TaxID=2030880 RepID=A0A2A5CI59_9GAMM|nr:MAG: glutamine--fructose-6-phosphate transaminase (isomerizing) [SAR86 cluster bacterium]